MDKVRADADASTRDEADDRFSDGVKHLRGGAHEKAVSAIEQALVLYQTLDDAAQDQAECLQLLSCIRPGSGAPIAALERAALAYRKLG